LGEHSHLDNVGSQQQPMGGEEVFLLRGKVDELQVQLYGVKA